MSQTIGLDTGGNDKAERFPTWVFLWPAPSHQALGDSITALADLQRRLMVGGRLTPSG